MSGLAITNVRRLAISISTNRWLVGGLFVVLGLFVIWVFGLSVPGNSVSTFKFSDTGDVIQLPGVPLPTLATNVFLGLLIASAGLYHLIRGFSRAVLVLGLSFVLFVIAFLTWSIADQTLNMTGLLSSTVVYATPFLIGALSGIMCERSGVINIAIEGMMLIAALVSVIVASLTHNLWLGLIAGIASGGLISVFHAWLSIEYKVDQIISGTVINIFATGITNYLNLRVLQTAQNLNNAGIFEPTPIPVLSNIPILGDILFNQNVLVYLAIILMFVVNFVLFNTRWGLRTRAVGEHPRAADTLGINVFRIRYVNVIVGGLLAGLAGCFLTLGTVGRFDKAMTNGRGFIALAAMIFGNWTPFGALASSLIFGFADVLQLKLQVLASAIPSDFLLMAPYLATMVVLAGVIGRAVPPAADGKAYEKQ